jgi:uncharacterized membrane protein
MSLKEESEPMKWLCRLSVASLLLIVLTSARPLADAQVTAADAEWLIYSCHNLSLLTVRVHQAQVEVTTATRKATLAEAPTPSPARYTNGTVTLTGLDEYVRLEEPGAVYWCRKIPGEAPWHEASLRGIEFRAAGDDPVWSVEVDSGVGVEFATGLGAARTVSRFPPAELKGDKRSMTLSARSASHALTLVAEQRVCHQAGNTMTLTVTATLDGKTYSGCGRALAR